MAQPPSYNRQKNFADDFGNETDHSALNAELDRASNSINDIRMNLAILQADDGKLRPSVVTADSISEELRVSLVEGVVMDAQAMLDRSLAAADASSASARVAKASEEKALESSSRALIAAEEAEESAKSLALVTNPDWNATEGRAQILNRPELSAVAISGQYKDLDGKPGNLATTEDIAVLQEEIARKVEGVPVGTIEYFAMSAPPPGYLMADGTAVGRETYPDLFAAIGTVFGEGDGETTFNLPDLIDRFAQGSNTPGQKIEAGLPNITGNFYDVIAQNGGGATDVFRLNETGGAAGFTNSGTAKFSNFNFDPSRSNRIYGASDTVQPPALTLLPCIKAFDAATNPGLINITGLANEIAGKVDRYIDNKPVRYVIDAYNDGTNWWRKWSDGWVEQGGYITNISGGVKVNLPLAMSSHIYFYSAISREAGDNANIVNYAPTSTNTVLHLNAIMSNGSWSPVTIVWEVKGQGAQS